MVSVLDSAATLSGNSLRQTVHTYCELFVFYDAYITIVHNTANYCKIIVELNTVLCSLWAYNRLSKRLKNHGVSEQCFVKIIKYPVRSRIAISNEIYYTLARYMLDGSV